MKTTTFFTIFALMANTLNASACSNACVTSIQNQQRAICGNGSNASSSACLCNSYAQLLQCYNQCNDPQSREELMNYQAQSQNVCNTALQGQNNMINNQFFANGVPTNVVGPTPTINGLFAATTVGSDVVINAGGTQVNIPFSGMPSNTNTPVIGSLYSTYNLGSISVGYRSATPTFGYRSTSSGYISSSNFALLSLASLIPAIFYN